jgi:hypothetical protein
VEEGDRRVAVPEIAGVVVAAVNDTAPKIPWCEAWRARKSSALLLGAAGGKLSPDAIERETCQSDFRFELRPWRFLGSRGSQGFRGYLQVDPFSGYDRICAGPDVIEVACWAHVRRKF